ncbi:MAG TPA: glycosyltransferase [Dokdonella sp.]|uniref:glycosyltransferase n=1 Tax=Dokdonella sp. TaxID=2291710 RepID=UPI002D7F5738|nr:glycosyltransferase [Dokdonella sp.]HET9034258.1 glycosyltransferase [Dokdonella sp.]
MKERSLISVCIVTLNQRRYVRQCVESVLEQSVDADLEILVGDDCSSDGTSEIVAELAAAHPDVISHFRHNPRLGAFENMKGLIGRASGDFIARVDADDYWLPGKLERQLDYLVENPDCSAVYTNALTIDDAGNAIGRFNDIGDQQFDLAEMLRRGNFLNNSSVLFRPQGKLAWLGAEKRQIDYWAHLFHARNGFLAQIGEPLTAYRVSSAGSMVAHANEHVRKMYWEAIMSVPRELISDDDLAHGIADFMRRAFYRALLTRNATLLKEWIPRALAASPFGAIRTGALVLGSIIRMAYKELIGRMQKDAQGRRLRVLYRR